MSAAKSGDARIAHERALIERATYFTVFRYGGRGNRDRREFPCADASPDARKAALAKAREDAAGDSRALVYAVTRLGEQAHVEEGFAWES